MFADDLNQISDMIGHLQNLIGTLEAYCCKWNMSLNLDKTKVMVFRNGGILKKNEKWFFKGKQIECTTYYKYLGLMVSSRLNWTVAQQTLASQANKAVAFLQQATKNIPGIEFNMLWNFFDKMV